MWLIAPPSTSSPSAPASEVSTWELSLPLAQRLASCATLSGKHSPPRSWQRAWKSKPWLRRLSGVTCEPSTAARGVDAWISSLAATRASRSAPPAVVVARVIRDTFGQTSLASLRKLNPASCSLRTSLATSLWDSPTSDASLRDWGIELRRDCLRRRKLARRIGGSDCSSSAWPTARSEDAESSGRRVSRGVADTLTAVTAMWPTAGANDHKGSAEKGQRRGQLDEATEHWTTPQAHDTHPRGLGNRSNPKAGNACLAWDAQEWSKPRASEAKGVAYQRDRGTKGLERPSLTGEAQTFPSSLPGPAASTSGVASSIADPSSRPRLNPAFVEWLMGWPEGWTDFAPAETAWSLWSLRMRSCLCGLVCGRATE